MRAAIGVIAGLLTPACLAHHSGAMWDSSRTVLLSGIVKEFQWTNPHCFIQLAVPADRGHMQEWSIEMSSPFRALQGGWKPGTVKPGDRVKVSVHPARDGTRAGNFVSAVGANGEPLGKSP
jgi:hypothetical protein